MASIDNVDQILSRLTTVSPGFSASLITEAEREWYGSDPTPHIDVIAFGGCEPP
jgi:hypothetical protein